MSRSDAESLKALGLSPVEGDVYGLLVDRHAATITQLHEWRPDLSRGRLQAAVAALRTSGLVSRLPNKPVRYVAVAPEMALETLILARQEDLRRVRASVEDLGRRWRRAERAVDGHELVEIVSGLDATRQRVEQIQRSARHEVMICDKPPYVDPTTVRNPVEFEVIQETQVRYRVLYDRTSLELPGRVEDITESIAAGELGRVASEVPIKMILADRRIGMIQLHGDPEALDSSIIVHPCGLLDALHALFETLWIRAVPLTRDRPLLAEHELVVDDHLIRLLAAGLTDQAIARQLDIGYRTAQRRIQSLMTTLGASNRLQLGICLVRDGWLR
ncbi:helix-turn-helix domain-containing protein [Nocardioides speluncae]|uniref:helix-turn-helix domain-containing protein n=1 Tax=Nocardioides speluncae TaxID=2670337 RepID=UPI00137A3298|nr:helix-turn-helix domain-containing protein [Nocardioides speluncae]